jgi:hypothetical protein
MMGWTPPERGEILVIAKPTKVTRTKGIHPMSTVTIAVDLAKHVFEIAIAGRAGTIRERRRLSRPQFEQFWSTRAPCRVVMEACASSHFWARYLIARGFVAPSVFRREDTQMNVEAAYATSVSVVRLFFLRVTRLCRAACCVSKRAMSPSSVAPDSCRIRSRIARTSSTIGSRHSSS